MLRGNKNRAGEFTSQSESSRNARKCSRPRLAHVSSCPFVSISSDDSMTRKRVFFCCVYTNRLYFFFSLGFLELVLFFYVQFFFFDNLQCTKTAMRRKKYQLRHGKDSRTQRDDINLECKYTKKKTQLSSWWMHKYISDKVMKLLYILFL